MEVEYDDYLGAKGPKARFVRLPGSSRTTGKKEGRRNAPQQDTGFSGSAQSSGTGYRFLNPYNFVRYLPFPARSKNEEIYDQKVLSGDWEIDQALMGRCPPPGHDRYVSLNGRIVCRAEAVTPLFISDSHDIQVEGNNHRSYRFFRYDGRKALPASSLRGMVRPVFEAATNSCFAIFNGEQRLSYHHPAHENWKLVPARVEKAGEELKLRLLPGTTEIKTEQRPQ
ncbi:MAG: hypothetical protein K6U74_10280, partial [Firmicutes bacterium]|nr:hypothetical protein [Bacillota bacterium]